MANLKEQEATLNIWYNLPNEIWEKIPAVYQSLPGWLGFGKDGYGEEGIPYWYSYENDHKIVYASVEPGGLQLCGRMDDNEWALWLNAFKETASRMLGFKVGVISAGEVDYDIDYNK